MTLAGRRWSGEGLDAETVNGPVTLRMPRGYAAHLESGTVHGPARAAEQHPPRAARGPRRWGPGGRISTDVNGGGPTIRVVTTNGPVSIERDVGSDRSRTGMIEEGAPAGGASSVRAEVREYGSAEVRKCGSRVRACEVRGAES